VIRFITGMKSGDKSYLLFLRNDDYPLLYQVKGRKLKR
jgi:hypothetical protein